MEPPEFRELVPRHRRELRRWWDNGDADALRALPQRSETSSRPQDAAELA
jgi:hypothetical protein